MLDNLLPFPLHPAVVHLPIALTVLVPLFAVGALVAIHRGAKVPRAWGLAAAMLATLSLSAFAALQTGEAQEEKVEAVVPERAFESHEDAAKGFLVLSAAVLGVAVVGLLAGRVGTAARVVATAGTLALTVAGYRVGHSGGALVYRHNAASAYASGAATPAPGDTGDGERGARADRAGADEDDGE